MRKKGIYFSMLSAAILAFILLTPTNTYQDAYADEDITLPSVEKVDEGIFYEHHSLVPLRSIAEALGATVTWEKKEKRVTIKRENKKDIAITIDSVHATVNEEAITLDVPAKVIGGKTFVPLRLISQAFEADVTWEGMEDTRGTATITTPDHLLQVDVVDHKAEARHQAARKSELIEMRASWPQDVQDAIDQKVIFVGMTRDQVEASWGTPLAKVPNGIHEVGGVLIIGESWGYHFENVNHQLDFLEDELIAIR